MKDIVPKPDLRPLEVHLTFLKRNISKALPTNRLCSKTDAIAYHRAAAHLATFKVKFFVKFFFFLVMYLSPIKSNFSHIL